MEEIKIDKEEVKEVDNAEKLKPVYLAQVPTEYAKLFQTPEGTLQMEEYLVWLGNEICQIRKAVG